MRLSTHCLPLRSLAVVLVLLLRIAGGGHAAAQSLHDPNAHLWVSLEAQQRWNTHWATRLESQWRRHEFGRRWQQWQFRPIVSYHLSDVWALGGGYTLQRSFRYGAYPAPAPELEQQTFQQVVFSPAGPKGMAPEIRLRQDQRWIRSLRSGAEAPEPLDLSWRYQNRTRLRALLEVPLTQPRIQAGCVYLRSYYEVFAGLGNPGPLRVAQQRAAAGVGWNWDDAGSGVQLGYLYQRSRQAARGPDGTTVVEHNHTLHLQLRWHLDRR